MHSTRWVEARSTTRAQRFCNLIIVRYEQHSRRSPRPMQAAQDTDAMFKDFQWCWYCCPTNPPYRFAKRSSATSYYKRQSPGSPALPYLVMYQLNPKASVPSAERCTMICLLILHPSRDVGYIETRKERCSQKRKIKTKLLGCGEDGS